jgi:hypothetical protein
VATSFVFGMACFIFALVIVEVLSKVKDLPFLKDQTFCSAAFFSSVTLSSCFLRNKVSHFFPSFPARKALLFSEILFLISCPFFVPNNKPIAAVIPAKASNLEVFIMLFLNC